MIGAVRVAVRARSERVAGASWRRVRVVCRAARGGVDDGARAGVEEVSRACARKIRSGACMHGGVMRCMLGSLMALRTIGARGWLKEDRGALR
jgi:hypothetical protein